MTINKNKHIGSNFDEYLKDEGILEESQVAATKKVVAFQIEEAMEKRKITKKEMTLIEIENQLKKEYKVEDLRTLDRLDWYWISAKYELLSEEFMEKYEDKIDFACISYCQTLSEEFARKYHDKIYWKAFYDKKLLEKHCANKEKNECK